MVEWARVSIPHRDIRKEVHQREPGEPQGVSIPHRDIRKQWDPKGLYVQNASFPFLIGTSESPVHNQIQTDQVRFPFLIGTSERTNGLRRFKRRHWFPFLIGTSESFSHFTLTHGVFPFPFLIGTSESMVITSTTSVPWRVSIPHRDIRKEETSVCMGYCDMSFHSS